MSTTTTSPNPSSGLAPTETRSMFTVDMRPTWTVTTEAFKPNDGAPTVVYQGHNRDRAVEAANFWDEYANTWLEPSGPPRGALARAMWRLDKLADLVNNYVSDRTTTH